jgi:ABC-2 type transport system ATP-binding protein
LDAVVTKSLAKRYDEVEALRGIDLSVREGETFGLLGPNGAGKTTLISILTTMLPPTSGEAFVAGHDVARDSDAVRKSLGVVFQNSTLDQVMTGEENLRIHGRLYKVPRADLDRRIPELLDIAGLTDRAKDRVTTYSGGMKRRLEIVRSILHRPKVLLLDEPTVALDPQSRETVWEYIGKISKEHGITTLVTTHYMEEADRLCDRIAIVDHGKLVALDSPAALKSALGGDRLELVVADGDATTVAERLETLSDVLGVTATPTTLSIRLREPATTIPSIMHEIADANMRVARMDHKPSSMQDVFLKQTGRTARDKRKKKRSRLMSFLGGR